MNLTAQRGKVHVRSESFLWRAVVPALVQPETYLPAIGPRDEAAPFRIGDVIAPVTGFAMTAQDRALHGDGAACATLRLRVQHAIDLPVPHSDDPSLAVRSSGRISSPIFSSSMLTAHTSCNPSVCTACTY